MSQLNNKEDILKAAQKETYFGKEYEDRVVTNGTLLATGISLLVAIILFLTEYFVKRTWNIGLFAVTATVLSVYLLYEGIKVKSAWKIIAGSILALGAVVFILWFIGQVIA